MDSRDDGGGARTPPGARKITDPRAIRALAHPLRLSLLELIQREGQLTASQASEALGESTANMSWHLQVLGRYGFIEEAGGGRGRARPWKLVATGLQFGDAPGGRETTIAAEALARLFHERAFHHLRRWEDERHQYPPEWQSAAFTSELVTYLEPAELETLGQEMTDLLLRYRERALDKSRRPEEARPVHLVAFGHSLPPTASGS